MPKRICSVEDCGKATVGRGWCTKHYQRWKLTGDPIKTASGWDRDGRKRCSVTACGEDARARGWCIRHYHFWSFYGVEPEWVAEAIRRGCAICGENDATRYAVDHDHACCPGRKSCGECVRGVLCHSCNRVLGIFRDSPARFQAAADYLNR